MKMNNYKKLFFRLFATGFIFWAISVADAQESADAHWPSFRGKYALGVADGKLCLPGEDGGIFVVKTGESYTQVAKNEMGERIMASPALSDGILYIRAQHDVFAIGQ